MIQRTIVHDDKSRDVQLLRRHAAPFPQIFAQLGINTGRNVPTSARIFTLVRRAPPSRAWGPDQSYRCAHRQFIFLARTQTRPARERDRSRCSSRGSTLRRGAPRAPLRARRSHRRTQPSDFVAAHIAGPARRPLRSFTKMQTDLPVPATRGINKSADDVITLPSFLVFLGITELLNKVRQQARVFLLPQQHAIRGQPIASRPPSLLVILLNRFR